MKPKLIIINGPLGSGKSTIAKKYAEDHPLTLLLDIDQVWSLIGGWREYYAESAQTAKKMALEMAKINLSEGHNVVIPQIYRSEKQYGELENLSSVCRASLHEFLLDIPKEEAIERFINRGKTQGNPNGFRPESTIKKQGGVTKLAEMYDEMIAVISTRPHTIRIVPKLNDIEATYTEFISKL